jgi:hypothetical protein
MRPDITGWAAVEVGRTPDGQPVRCYAPDQETAEAAAGAMGSAAAAGLAARARDRQAGEQAAVREAAAS